MLTLCFDLVWAQVEKEAELKCGRCQWGGGFGRTPYSGPRLCFVFEETKLLFVDVVDLLTIRLVLDVADDDVVQPALSISRIA